MAFTERQAKALKWEGKDRLVSAGDGLYLNVRGHVAACPNRFLLVERAKIKIAGIYAH